MDTSIPREEQENGELDEDYEEYDSDEIDDDNDDDDDDDDSNSDGEKEGGDDLRDLVKELAAMGIPGGKTTASTSSPTPAKPAKITISHTPIAAPKSEV